jgi:hypothetical protein
MFSGVDTTRPHARRVNGRLLFEPQNLFLCASGDVTRALACLRMLITDACVDTLQGDSAMIPENEILHVRRALELEIAQGKLMGGHMVIVVIGSNEPMEQLSVPSTNRLVHGAVQSMGCHQIS